MGTDEEYLEAQIEAFKALVTEIGPGTALLELAGDLLSHVQSRDGKRPFTESAITEKLKVIVQRKSPSPSLGEEQDLDAMINKNVVLNSVKSDTSSILEVARDFE